MVPTEERPLIRVQEAFQVDPFSDHALFMGEQSIFSECSATTAGYS